MNGHAMAIDWKDDTLCGWLDAENRWKTFDNFKVYKVAFGKEGRLYKVDRDFKIF